MNDAVQILKQFKDFSIFKEMNGVIQKLEDSVYASKQKAIIHLDKNERLKGLEFIDTLYDAILNKNVLKIEYKSFKARETNYYIIHPQLLKEYNNRWFLITWDEMTYLTLALDRVISIEKINAEYIDKNIDGDHFFKEVIGVTVSQRNRPMNVIFWIDKKCRVIKESHSDCNNRDENQSDKTTDDQKEAEKNLFGRDFHLEHSSQPQIK